MKTTTSNNIESKNGASLVKNIEKARILDLLCEDIVCNDFDAASI